MQTVNQEKTVKLFAMLRDKVGAKEITIDFIPGQTVRDVLTTISRTYPVLGEEIIGADGELTGLVHVLVGGRNIMWLEGLDTVIQAENSLVLLPPAAGG
ncbi:MAG: ubiquitin-like small modifier protein 1 [Anaerolineales bacterium]